MLVQWFSNFSRCLSPLHSTPSSQKQAYNNKSKNNIICAHSTCINTYMTGTCIGLHVIASNSISDEEMFFNIVHKKSDITLFLWHNRGHHEAPYQGRIVVISETYTLSLIHLFTISTYNVHSITFVHRLVNRHVNRHIH